MLSPPTVSPWTATRWTQLGARHAWLPGLARYYRKFIPNFSMIVTPLDARHSGSIAGAQARPVHWTGPTDDGLRSAVRCRLRRVGQRLRRHPSLGSQPLPPTFFSRPFNIGGRTYGSLASFAARHLKLAAYERAHRPGQAIQHWQTYLWDWCFLVRTDHYNLYFLLDHQVVRLRLRRVVRALHRPRPPWSHAPSSRAASATSIVSNRDPVFTVNIWCDLFKMVGVKLCMSTALHPRMDGES